MLRFFVLIVVLLIALAWLTRVREQFIVAIAREGFEGGTTMTTNTADTLQQLLRADTADIQGVDPAKMIGRVRQMLEQVDRPELWEHAVSLSDKDPAQLARMQLGIQNGDRQ